MSLARGPRRSGMEGRRVDFPSSRECIERSRANEWREKEQAVLEIPRDTPLAKLLRPREGEREKTSDLCGK